MASEGADLLNAALGYAADGWKVHPLHWMEGGTCSCRTKCGSSAAKHPLVKDWDEAATDDPDIIQGWWAKWPTANIGLATGPGSDLWVLDLDAKKSVTVGDTIVPEGEHSLRRLEHEHGGLAPTVVVATPSGGRHLYFRYPANGGEHGNGKNIRPSIDVRGAGGYVVAPPSIGESGGRYRFLDDTHIPESNPPEWLLALNRERSRGGLRNLGEGERVAAGQGRHDYLTQVAGKLRGYHSLDGSQLLGALHMTNRTDLDPPLDIAEVEHIYTSAMGWPRGEIAPTFKWQDDPEPGEAEDLPVIREGQDVTISLFDLFSDPPPEPAKLVHGLLNAGEGAILGAKPNVGKSWIAMLLALSVASGEPFLGHFEVEQGGVLYLDEEGSLYHDYNRFRMLAAGQGLGSVQGIPIELAIQKGIRLDKREGQVALRRMLERHQPRLVIFDALIRFHGLDENSNQQMSEFLHIARRIMTPYDASFFFLHHMRKASLVDTEDLAEQFRGAGDIRGWADSMFVLEQNGERGDLKLTTVKQRNLDIIDPFGVRIVYPVPDSPSPVVKIAYAGPTKGQPTNIGTQGRILEIVERLTTEGKRPTVEAIAVELEKTAGSVKPVIKGLVGIGKLDDYQTQGTYGGPKQTAYRIPLPKPS